MKNDTTPTEAELEEFDALKLLKAFRAGYEDSTGTILKPSNRSQQAVPTDEFKQHKRSLRAGEDNHILSTYGEAVSSDDLPAKVQSFEQVLRDCEAELESYQFREFDEPSGRDRIQAAIELVNAWGAHSRNEPTAALHLYKAARALERLRIEALTKPPKRSASTYLEAATRLAWLDCGGSKANPTFEEIKGALADHGVTESTRREKTNKKNPDGSQIIRTVFTGKLQWKEPDSKKVEKIAEGTLRNRLSKWRKQWINDSK